MTKDNCLTDEMKNLILSYIEAANANDKVKEEALLHKIRQLSLQKYD